MSTEKSVIPAKILKDFDFSQWDVSAPAMKELRACLKMPIIKLAYEKEIVLKNSELYETLVTVFSALNNSGLDSQKAITPHLRKHLQPRSHQNFVGE